MKTSLLLVAFSSLAVLLAVAAPPPARELNKAELKQYSDLQEKLYPEKGSIYDKVTKVFPENETFTAEMITAVENPKVPYSYTQADYDLDIKTQNAESPRSEKVPVDAFAAEDAKKELRVYMQTHDVKEDLAAILEKKYGIQPWYKATELREVEEKGSKGKSVLVERNFAKLDTPQSEEMINFARQVKIQEREDRQGFQGLLVRQSWRDVLYQEDPTQLDKAKASLGDLVGATVNFTRDYRAESDTWAAQGALIVPWQHHFVLREDFFSPDMIAFAPSVNVNRNDTNGKPDGETDSLLFRAGFYGDFHLWTAHDDRHQITSIGNLEVRAAAVYATDTGFRAELPGYEVDLEPRIFWKPFPIGYKSVWWHKEPLKDDGTDNSLFDTQLRIWLHVEGGDAQDVGSTWAPASGSFFRLGPSAQFQARWPKLVFGKDLSFTAQGTYLPSASGPNQDHEFYYKLSLVYDLLDKTTATFHHKISINANYENGGLAFTKENVNRFTIGLGILF